jgi:Arc/MetJ-type ribon-helix-helix transcriptional regulator
MTKTMSRQVTFRIPEDLPQVDEAVAQGEYESRAELLRAGLQLVLAARRELAIAEAYRRAYEGVEADEALLNGFGVLAAKVISDRERE